MIIHEGQLTYAKDGLVKLLDLGQWWRDETGLPLPLGGNAIRRSLGAETHEDHDRRTCATAFSTLLIIVKRHLTYAMQFARDLDTALPTDSSECTSMNARLNYGDDGRQAIHKLLDMGFDRGIISHRANVDFVG